MLIRRLVIGGALAAISLALTASPIPFEPYLDCAGSRAYYLYLLKSSRYDDADVLKEVEDSLQFYLQVAESLSQRSLRKEFVEASEREKQKAEKIIKASGSKAYLAYEAARRDECTSMVKRDRVEIMKAADKLYEGQVER